MAFRPRHADTSTRHRPGRVTVRPRTLWIRRGFLPEFLSTAKLELDATRLPLTRNSRREFRSQNSVVPDGTRLLSRTAPRGRPTRLSLKRETRDARAATVAGPRRSDTRSRERLLDNLKPRGTCPGSTISRARKVEKSAKLERHTQAASPEKSYQIGIYAKEAGSPTRVIPRVAGRAGRKVPRESPRFLGFSLVVLPRLLLRRKSVRDGAAWCLPLLASGLESWIKLRYARSHVRA